MQDARGKFRELTRVFDPIYRQDVTEGTRSSYVPEAHEDYRKQLEASLDLNDNAKLLVAGQPGCGKTTLLLNLAHRLRQEGRIVAFVDLEAQTVVQDLGSVEMYLAAMAELLSEAKKARASVPPDTLDACRSWIERLQDGGTLEGDPEALAETLRRFLFAVRESERLRGELRFQVKQGGDDPLDLVARLLQGLGERTRQAPAGTGARHLPRR
jgi:DNA polymerase III delta prime subunit